MKLSRASTYAVYGLSYLAGQPDRLVPLSEIRSRCGLPEKHLAKIFQILVRSGHLKAARGARGGFALAKPAELVSALDIIRLVDGPVRSEKCPIHPAAAEGAPCCPISQMVFEGREKMSAVFRSVTLAQLAKASVGRNPSPPQAFDHT
jgi:Rrf2 family protein